LVDLPGLDSGIAAHERVIDNYASRSLAYGVVVSIQEGGLRKSLRRALLELAVAQMPVVLILSKADTQRPEEVHAVAERVTADITALMGRAPMSVPSPRRIRTGPISAHSKRPSTPCKPRPQSSSKAASWPNTGKC
jgi:GTPase